MSTGAFRVAETDTAGLPALLARVEARELLVADHLLADEEVKRPLAGAGAALVPLPRAFFDGATAHDRLAAFYGVRSLDAFGGYGRGEATAAAALVAYVEKTQVGARPPLDPPRRDADAGVMAIDAATRANLELVRTLAGERRGSLLHAVDLTVTGAGARLLADRLASPLADPVAIRDRLDAVEVLVEAGQLRGAIRSDLASVPDIARATTRLAMGRGGPRDLAAVAEGLAAARRIRETVAAVAAGGPELGRVADGLDRAPAGLADDVASTLADELPLLKRDGGFVRTGRLEALDEARALRDESRKVIAALQARYADETGVKGLKVRHNGVLGYFVEVAAQHGGALTAEPHGRQFIHRQTMANAMRFTTTELGELEGRIASAGERALVLELAEFDRLSAAVVAAADDIKAVAGALAALDVAAAFAELADREGWCRPRVDDGLAFRIEGGRHPVVEAMLRAEGQSFVPNGCDLGGDDAGRLWLVTGPNMAGKSTFLRQNALIAILAQTGSFVPATAAHIGVVDRLFSRVGAADDLARGRSTFMVEMIETAAILNQAGPRSLVILDEIGRGTATFDGLSIAWAAVEHLHEVNRSRALFATHYHELTALTERLSRVIAATVRVREWKGDVVFLHEIVPGAADRSYGIQVARLAGLPAAVVERAKAVLDELEKSGADRAPAILDDLPLFTAARQRPAQSATRADPAAAAILAALDALVPDDMTPREALEALYRLKADRARSAAD
jgi:DNA mismatch repair protein MutS